GQRLRVRIDQELVLVEAKASRRIERAADAVAVELPGTRAVDERVEDETRPLFEADHVGGLVVGAIEEEEKDLGGVAAVEGEVDAALLRRGAEWVEATGGHLARRARLQREGHDPLRGRRRPRRRAPPSS